MQPKQAVKTKKKVSSYLSTIGFMSKKVDRDVSIAIFLYNTSHKMLMEKNLLRKLI